MTGARLLLALGLVAAAAAITVAADRICGAPRGPVVVTAVAEAAPPPAPAPAPAPVVLPPIAVPLPDAGTGVAAPDAGPTPDAGDARASAPLEPSAPLRLPLVALPVRRPAGSPGATPERPTAAADAGVALAADAGPARTPKPAGAADAGTAAPAVATPDAPAGTAALEVFFKDELTSWLRLESVELAVDGAAPLGFKVPPGGDGKPPVLIKRLQVAAGPHRGRVRARYAGAGGIFAYMEGYKVTVVATTVVESPRGTSARVTAVAYDQGAMVAWEKRAQLRIELSTAPR